jgi:hypothetical protein
MRVLTLLGCCTVVAVCSSCEFFADLGAADVGIGDAALGRAAALLESDAVVGRTLAGFELRAVAGEASVYTSEALAASPAYRGIFEELTTRGRLPLYRDAGGFLRIGESRLGVTTNGEFTLGRTVDGGLRVVGRISEGKVWEVDVLGRSVKPIGDVYAETIRGQVALRASPSAKGAFVDWVRPGVKVQVLRVSGDWFEVALHDGTSAGWVFGSGVELISATAPKPNRAASPRRATQTGQCEPVDSAYKPPSQTSRGIVLTARSVQLLGTGRARVVVTASNPSADGAVAVAIHDNASRNCAWKCTAVAKGSLADDLGTSYQFASATGLPFSLDGVPWTVIEAGESLPLIFEFEGRPAGICPRTYSLSVELSIANRETSSEAGSRTVIMFLDGIRRF